MGVLAVRYERKEIIFLLLANLNYTLKNEE